MDTDAGRRASAEWRTASAELERLAQRLQEETAALPEAAREALGSRIAGVAASLRTGTAGCGRYCAHLADYTDSSTADTDKEVYTMYAFGLMTVYQLLVAGGWHPLRAMQVLSEARSVHLARFAAFVAERAGAGAAAVAERAGLLVLQVGGFAALTGGVDLGVQVGQMLGILDGHREGVEWDSVATSAAAGAGAGIGGVVGGRVAHAIVPQASSALLGRAVVAAVAGMSGVIGGAAAAAGITGRFEVTLSALTSGAAVGMAAAHAQARTYADGAPHGSAEGTMPDGRPADRLTQDVREYGARAGAEAAEYRRMHGLREQELAETRAVADTESAVPAVETAAASRADPAELARRVAVRDTARAELAHALDMTPDDLRSCGRPALEKAVGEVDSWIRSLGHDGWSLLDPAVRDGVLGDLKQRVVDRARAIAAGEQNSAPVHEWLRQEGLAEPVADSVPGQWSALRRIAEAHGAEPVVRALDAFERYGDADAQVGALDRRATDTASESATGTVRNADRSASAGHEADHAVGVGETANRAAGTGQSAGTGAYAGRIAGSGEGGSLGATQGADGSSGTGEGTGPSAGGVRDDAVVGERTGDVASEGAGVLRPEGQGRGAAEAGSDALEQSVQELGINAGAEAVDRARAADFAVLQRESARAGTALAEWLGLSDTVFHSMTPSQLRAAVEHWVGRAEVSPELGTQARPHAGKLIGDEVRRAVEADRRSGRVLVGGDETTAAQAVSGQLLGRLRDWVGGDAAAVERWSDVHANLDRMLSSPNSLLRLGAGEESAPVSPTLRRAQHLYELELAETAATDGSALTPEAAQALAAAGLPLPAASHGDMSALTPAAADALAAAGLRPSVPGAAHGGSSALTPAAADALAAAGLRPSAPPEASAGGSGKGDGTSPIPDQNAPGREGGGGNQGLGRVPDETGNVDGIPSPGGEGGDTQRPGRGDGGKVEPVDPVRAAEQERTQAQGEQGGAESGGTALTPAARDALAAAGLRPSADAPAGNSGERTAPGGAKNDGTGRYSAPDATPAPESSPAGKSNRGSVRVAEQEVAAQSVPVDPVKEAALAEARESHRQEIDETRRASESSRGTPSSGESAPAPHAEPAAAAADASAETADPQAGRHSPAPGTATTAPHPVDPADAPVRQESNADPSSADHRPLTPGAAMLGAATAADDDDAPNTSAPHTDSTPNAESTTAGATSGSAAPGSPSDEASPADEAGTSHHTAPRSSAADPHASGGAARQDDPAVARQEHTEATAAAAELLGMTPPELRVSGWRLLGAAVDRVEAAVEALGTHGWDLLSPGVRAALLADLGEVIGRELREQADTHRRGAAVLEWLRENALTSDGTAPPAGQRFSRLRRLAEEYPGSALGSLVETLERFVATGVRLEALPAVPIAEAEVRSRPAEDARPVRTAPVTERSKLELGGYGWLGSPLRAEWIRLGMERAALAWELAREHGLEIDYWAVRPGSAETERLHTELDTATGELANLLAVDPEELSPGRIEQLLTETATDDPDTGRLDAIAHRYLLISELLDTAAAFERIHARALVSGVTKEGPERTWLQRLIRMDPGELSRRWQALRATPARDVRAPGISSRYTGPPPPLRCLPAGQWRMAGEGSDDPRSRGVTAPVAPDVPRSPTPIDCAPVVMGYLLEENGSAAVARKLADTPLTPSAELGGTTVAQVESVLGGRFRPFASWQELTDELAGMAPGASAIVGTESDPARAVAGHGHARLVFHDRAQPGVVKVRDPGTDDGAKKVFAPGKQSPGVRKFAVVLDASGDVLPRPAREPRSVVRGRTPLLAMAGTDERDDSPPQSATAHETPRPLETTLAGLGTLAKDVVVVGSSAMYAALAGAMRPPNDMDVSVSEDGFRHLRAQGWSERRFPDGFVVVTNGEIEASIGRGGVTHNDLAARAWRTESGIRVAGLSDITAAKWRRGLPKDFDDLDRVRSALLDPGRTPLAESVLGRQIRKVRATLPEWVLEHPYAPVAVRLAADGMYAVNALYGDPEVGAILQIVGELEKPEFLVPASYHNGFGLEADLRRLQDHMDNIRAGALERLLAMAADANSDLKFGGGRMSDSPEAYDELVSATILRQRALSLAPQARDEAQLLFEAVESTAFDQYKGEQKGRFHDNAVVRAVCGIDLQNLSEYDSLAVAAALAPEDLASRRTRAFYSQIFGRTLIEESARITTLAEAAQFLQDNRDRRPILENGGLAEHTLGQTLGLFYIANARFVHPRVGYQYPMGWSLEDIELRLEHSKRSQLIGNNLLSGRWTPRDADEAIAEHTEVMRRRAQRRLEQDRAAARWERARAAGIARPDWAVNVVRIERDMTGGDVLAAGMYGGYLAEIRAQYGDDLPRRALATARRAAWERVDRLTAELDHAAGMRGADTEQLIPHSEYLAQWVREFESKALELADAMMTAWQRGPIPGWDRYWSQSVSSDQLAAQLSRFRNGPQTVLRIIQYFQHGLRDLKPGQWARIVREAPGGKISRLPVWFVLAIIDPDTALTLADVLDARDPVAEQDPEREWIADAMAEWRVLGEALGRSSESGHLIETATEYLELARVVDIPSRLDNEQRVLAAIGEMERELQVIPVVPDDEAPGTHSAESLSRDIDALARVRGLRDHWLELCDIGPDYSSSRLGLECAELAASLTADLRAAGRLPADTRLTPHLAGRIEADYAAERQQALPGTRGDDKTAALRNLPDRLARYRRLRELLSYIVECRRREESIDYRIKRLPVVRGASNTARESTERVAHQWLPVSGPRDFRPERADILDEWTGRIAAAAGERRRVFEAAAQQARRLGVEHPERRSPQELRRAVDEIFEWADVFRSAAPYPAGSESEQAAAAHVGTFGDLVRRQLVLLDHALDAEHAVRAEAAAAVARDMLEQKVTAARGGQWLAPRVAVVATEGAPPEVYVAGPVAALDRVLDEVGSDVRAELAEQGARFHYTEVAVDEAGRAHLRDVRPVVDPVAAEGDSGIGETSVGSPAVHSPGSAAESPAASDEEWAAARAAVERRLGTWRLAGAEGERVTDCVAFLPSGAGGQLVVAAPAGMHRRVLLDVVTKDARFVAARWHPVFDRQYVEVTSGPRGPVVAPISARTAEGRFREATDAELEAILLEEYLRFRRVGLVTASFRDWLGELGKQVFYGRKDARRSRATRAPVVAGHLKRDGTLQAFGYAAAEARPELHADLPHPLAVLIRAVTRQIPLPAEPDPGGPGRVVLRGEIDLGALAPVVELVADGLLWRVAPPRGHGDPGDVLNRWLQGMSDRDPDRLLRRIEEAAAAGEVPATTRASAVVPPRHYWEVSATTRKAFTVDVTQREDGWYAVPTARAVREGALEPVVEPDLPSVMWRVAAQVRDAGRDATVRAPIDLDITLSPEEVRRYDDLVRAADTAMGRLNAWRRAGEATAARLGIPEHDALEPEVTAALWETVRDDRARLADELGVAAVELTAVPLPDNDVAARRDQILRREADLREYDALRSGHAAAAGGLSEAQRRRDSFLTDRVVTADLRLRGAGRKVGEGIGYVPDDAGGLLLIAAPPGGHMANLVRLAAERPQFADALWRDGLEKRYLEVTAGADGRVAIRTVPAAEAEGRRRRQSAAEIRAQLLDHYLSYRTAGAVALGFDRWLGLSAVEDPFGDPDRLAWLGHQMVRAEPAIERTHPAHVLHRLWVRQVPPLPEAPERAERANIVVAELKLGDAMTSRVPLEHEDGMWRLAAGGGSEIGDVLARHFPGLSAVTPDALVRSIDDFLRENAVWNVLAAHQLSTVRGACFPVAALAVMYAPGPRPRFDIPGEVLDGVVPAAGFDGGDIARWTHANWHPNGFRDAAAIVAHVRRTGGTVLGAVDFGVVGAHAFTVRRDAGVTVVVEQVSRLDIGGAVHTSTRIVRGEEAVDAWAGQLTRTVGEGATFHGLAFKADGTPELPLHPDREPTGRRGREFPIRPLRGRPPERGPPEDDPGIERDLGAAQRRTAPADRDPAARSAVARRVAEQAAQRMRELAELVAPHGIEPAELSRTGSPTWSEWFARYQQARGSLADLLGFVRGRAVGDDRILHALAEGGEKDYSTSEFADLARTFTENARVAELLDDIHRLRGWADTVEAVEAELLRPPASRPRLDEQARDLYALGTTLEAYEQESVPHSPTDILAAARRFRSSSWESRAGLLLLHARVRRLLAEPDSSGVVSAADIERLERLSPRIAAAVEHYDTIHLLKTDLDNILAQLNRTLAGIHVVADGPLWYGRELPEDAGLGETMAAVRADVVHRRRHAFTALLDGPSGEFALDIAALDEPGGGAYDLSRLTAVPPGESERVDTTIRLIHELGRGRRQLAQIDTLVAAIDEADHRMRLGEQRLARLVSEHLRRFPLDHRIARGALEPDRSTMVAAIRACAAELPGDGWDSPFEQVRRRVADLRQDSASPRTAYLAERYLGLRGLLDAFDDESTWSGWFFALEPHVQRLGRLRRDRADVEVQREAAEHRLRTLAPKIEADPDRWQPVSNAVTDVIRARTAALERYDAELDNALYAALATVGDAGWPEIDRDNGTTEYVAPEGHSASQCVPLTAALHKGRTGNENVRVPDDVGLAGVSLAAYTELLQGIPQRFTVERDRPHRRVVQALWETVANLPAEQRAGVSVIVVDVAGVVDEHGIGAHTYRLEYRCDEHGENGWVEQQDPGHELRRPWADGSAAADLASIWVMGFDRSGHPVRLPGAESETTPPDVRVGRDDPGVRPADPAAATPLTDLLADPEPDNDVLLRRLGGLHGRYGRLEFRVTTAYYRVAEDFAASPPRGLGLTFSGEITDPASGRVVWWPRFEIDPDDRGGIVVRFVPGGQNERMYPVEVYSSFIARLDNDYFGPWADRMEFVPDLEATVLVAAEPGVRWDPAGGRFEATVEALRTAARMLVTDITPTDRRGLADFLRRLEKAGPAGSAPADVLEFAGADDPRLGKRLLSTAGVYLVRDYGEYMAADPATRTAPPASARFDPVPAVSGEPTRTLSLRELLRHDEPYNALLRGVLPGDWQCGPYRVRATTAQYTAGWQFAEDEVGDFTVRRTEAGTATEGTIAGFTVYGEIVGSGDEGVGFFNMDVELNQSEEIVVTDFTYLDDGVPDAGFHAALAARTDRYFRENGVDRIGGTTLSEYGVAAIRLGAEWPLDDPVAFQEGLMNLRWAARRLRRLSTEADRTLLDEMMRRFAGRPADFPSPSELVELAGDNPRLGWELVGEAPCDITRRLRPLEPVTGPAARSAVGHRAATEAERLRRDLAARLWRRPVAPAELLRTGSPTWESWFTAYDAVRDRLRRVLGVGDGRVTDEWIAQAAARMRSLGPTTLETAAAADQFDKLQPIAQLVDGIHRLDRWARTVDAVERELSRHGAALSRTLALAHGLMTGIEVGRPGVLIDALGTVLARVVEQGAVVRHWEDRARRLYQLGVALEEMEAQRHSLEWAGERLRDAARDRGLEQREPHAISLATRERLRRMPVDASESDAAEELREMHLDAEQLAAVHDTLQRLEDDLYVLLAQLDSELAGNSAPAVGITGATACGRLAADLIPPRDALVDRRRRLLAELVTAGAEFDVDPTRVDSGVSGASELARLSGLRRQLVAERAHPDRLDRLDQVIDNARLLVRATVRIDRIDAVAAAFAEAEQQISVADYRLARFVAAHLRDFPLDRNLFRGDPREARSQLYATVLLSGMSLSARGWDVRHGSASPRSPDIARNDEEAVRLDTVARRYSALSRALDLVDQRDRWIDYRDRLGAAVETLPNRITWVHEVESGLVEASAELRRLAARTGVDLDDIGANAKLPVALRVLLGKDLRRAVAALGTKASIRLHSLAEAQAAELDMEEVSTAVEHAMRQLGDRADHGQTDLLVRCSLLREMVDTADDKAVWSDESASQDQQFDALPAVTMAPPFAEPTGSDGTTPYVPTDAHAANRCAPLTAELHRERTGRSDVAVPETVGLSGLTLRAYAEALHGDPQRFAVDRINAHFGLERSALAVIDALPPEQRDGVSLVVVDGTHEVDEHGVSAHTYRLEYRHDEHTNTGWFDLQDPGKQQFGYWHDTTRSADVAGIWAMAFDRHGRPLRLPGAETGTPPPELRIGTEESGPARSPSDASAGPGGMDDEADIRLAVARRVADRAARLRGELAELLRGHDIEAGELSRPGSSAWERWSIRHRRLRDDVLDMLGVERGGAVDDAWLRQVLAERRAQDRAAPEFSTAAEAFTESDSVVELVEEIRRLDTWARAVDAVEAALARRRDEARRLIAAPLARLRGIVGVAWVFRPLGALVPVIDSILAGVIDRLAAAHRLHCRAATLYALGTTIEDYERVLRSHESSHRQILSAAKQFGLPAWDSRTGMMLVLARSRHLLATARTSGDEGHVENLHRLVRRATMAVQLYDTIHLLDADMAAVISGEQETDVETPERSGERFGPASLREHLTVMRDDVARQRRGRFSALLDGPGDEFEVDIAALDEFGWGGHELTRLMNLQATRSDRLSATIGILRAIARANTLLTRIDMALAALDDADHLMRVANQPARPADIDRYDSDLDGGLDSVLDTVGTLGASSPRPGAPADPGKVSETVDLERADIITLQRALTDDVVTSADLVEGYSRRIELSDSVYPPLNAILALNPNAIAEAEQLDAERRQGHVRGPLHGIPILVKDNIDVFGMPTTAGSVALRDSYPARDAFIVQRLRDAGAVILGKTNLTEFANFMSEGMPDAWSTLGGAGRSPYGPLVQLGGSSRADPVAAGLAAAVIGTETAGSIVSPAVHNSVIGVKPVDLVSRTGILPVSATLDTAGVLARTVRDAAILLTVIAGPDPEDPVTERTADRAGTDYAAGLSRGVLRGRRIGVVGAPDNFGGAPAVFRALGATLIPVEVHEAGLPTPLFHWELGRDFERYRARFPAGAPIKTLDEFIRFNEDNLLAAGSAVYGQDMLHKVKAVDWNDPAALAEYEAHRELVLGTARERLDSAFASGEADVLLFFHATAHTVYARAKYPAVTIRIGYDPRTGQPLGATVVGRPGSEAALLNIAYDYEQEARVWRPPSEINPALFKGSSWKGGGWQDRAPTAGETPSGKSVAMRSEAVDRSLCARIIARHRHRTGRPAAVVADVAGPNGWSAKRLVEASGGRPQRLPVDPEHPYRRVEQSFRELVAGVDPKERDGMSLIVIDTTRVGEHGVVGDVSRWEYRYHERTQADWFELQGHRTAPHERHPHMTTDRAVHGILVMAFDRHGESLLLPGAKVVSIGAESMPYARDLSVSLPQLSVERDEPRAVAPLSTPWSARPPEPQAEASDPRLPTPWSGDVQTHASSGDMTRQFADGAAAMPFTDVDFIATVRIALADLPDAEIAEHVLLLHFAEGLPLTEVAARLRISSTTAARLAAEAARRLRRAFDRPDTAEGRSLDVAGDSPWAEDESFRAVVARGEIRAGAVLRSDRKPGHVVDGIRRFDSHHIARMYGETYLGAPFRDLSEEQRTAVLECVANSYVYQYFLRPTGFLDPAVVEQKLRDCHSDVRDGWSLFELCGRVPTLSDVRGAATRPDLTSVQRDLVARIIGSADPWRELQRTIRRPRSAGMRGALTAAFGKWPTVDDLRKRIGLVNEAVRHPLPEGLEVHRGLREVSFMLAGHSPYELVGTTWIEPGFTSATLGSGPVAVADIDPPVELHVSVPKGVEALWIGPNGPYPEQNEVLFAQGLGIRITTVRRTGAKWHLFGHVVRRRSVGGRG